MFLLTKANALACLERWEELERLLRYLLTRYPRDPEVVRHAVSLFKAHGDFRTAWTLLQHAGRAARAVADRNEIEFICTEQLECLHALGRTKAAIGLGRRVLKEYQRLPCVRITLEHLKNGTLRVEPWAPRWAKFLAGLRRAALRYRRSSR